MEKKERVITACNNSWARLNALCGRKGTQNIRWQMYARLHTPFIYFPASRLRIFSVCAVCPPACLSVCLSVSLPISLFKHLANIISVYCNSCLCMSYLHC